MDQLSLVRLNHSDLAEALAFLEQIFTQEQGIPREIIPLDFKKQYWWGMKDQNNLVGTVAAWEDNNEWHWGRLAIDSQLRGHGLAKKLAIHSIAFLFQEGVDHLTIDARDITVKLLLSLGARINGETTLFYDIAVTPMIFYKSDFSPV